MLADGEIGITTPISRGMDWYNKRKAKMIEYLGGRCAHCGDTENLEFDHVDPSQKSFTITERFSNAWNELVVELDKCQLLCFMCHHAKTLTAYPAIHNRWRYAKHGCRCSVCRSDRAAYRRERYLKEGR